MKNTENIMTPVQARAIIDNALTAAAAQLPPIDTAPEYPVYSLASGKQTSRTVDSIVNTPEAKAIFSAIMAARIDVYLVRAEKSAAVIDAEAENADDPEHAREAVKALLARTRDMYDLYTARAKLAEDNTEAYTNSIHAVTACLAERATDAELTKWLPTAYLQGSEAAAAIAKASAITTELVKTVKNDMVTVFKAYAPSVFVKPQHAKAVISTSGRLTVLGVKTHKEEYRTRDSVSITLAILNELDVTLRAKLYFDAEAKKAAEEAEKNGLETSMPALIEKAKKTAERKARATATKKTATTTKKTATTTEKTATTTEKTATTTEKTA